MARELLPTPCVVSDASANSCAPFDFLIRHDRDTRRDAKTKLPHKNAANVFPQTPARPGQLLPRPVPAWAQALRGGGVWPEPWAQNWGSGGGGVLLQRLGLGEGVMGGGHTKPRAMGAVAAGEPRAGEALGVGITGGRAGRPGSGAHAHAGLGYSRDPGPWAMVPLYGGPVAASQSGELAPRRFLVTPFSRIYQISTSYCRKHHLVLSPSGCRRDESF